MYIKSKIEILEKLILQKVGNYMSNSVSSNRPEKYNIAAFFSGVGGIELGFEQTNEFRVVYANEFDKYARQNYSFNPTIHPKDIPDEFMGCWV